jgi:LytS/YehU family sensor histidine kinase
MSKRNGHTSPTDCQEKEEIALEELVDLLEACAKMSVFLFLWCNLYFSIKRSRQHEQERERLLRAEAEAHEARLRALRYQLNPHFLFNSMNAVSTLIAEGSGPAATKALSQIAEFLRAMLDDEVETEVPLSQEMALTERYLLRSNKPVSKDAFG